MASRTYRVTFTPNDDKSTDAFELKWEIRTEQNGLGILLEEGRATSGSSTSAVVVDTHLTEGISNTRYIRTLDGAGNPFDTAFSVEVPEVPVEDVLEESVIAVGFVFEWRDHRYNFISDLTPAIETADVQLLNDRTVARSAIFRMDPNQFPVGFDPDVDRVSIRAKFLREDLGTQYPLGLFALDVGQTEYHATGKPVDEDTSTDEIPTPIRFIEADGADVCSHLEEEIVQAPYTVASGTNYITEVISLIETVTFVDFTGNARPLRYEIPATDLTTPVDFTWPPQTSTLQIINDLLAGINFYPLFADGQAVLRSKERKLPWNDSTDVVYTTQAEPRLVVSPFVRRALRGQYPNQILASVDDPAREVLTVSRANTDPNSLNSTAKTKPFLKTANTPHIADATTQRAFADFELIWGSANADRATLTTSFDPRRTGREIYNLKIGGVEDDTLWVSFGWALSMRTGSLMLHDVGRASELVFEDLTL
jgi:hypothetical protein